MFSDVLLLTLSILLTSVVAQEFLCSSEGLYTNPSDCGGYFQCANGVSTPYVRKCAPGSHFDEEQHTCLAIPDVHCNGRPVSDSLPSSGAQRPQSNTYQSNSLQFNVPTNTVTLRLNNRQSGPLLGSEQCAEIGRQLSRYLRTLVSNYEPSCTVSSVCQQNLPTFKVECQTSTGR